jgi:hypothetical protein
VFLRRQLRGPALSSIPPESTHPTVGFGAVTAAVACVRTRDPEGALNVRVTTILRGLVTRKVNSIGSPEEAEWLCEPSVGLCC